MPLVLAKESGEGQTESRMETYGTCGVRPIYLLAQNSKSAGMQYQRR